MWSQGQDAAKQSFNWHTDCFPTNGQALLVRQSPSEKLSGRADCAPESSEEGSCIMPFHRPPERRTVYWEKEDKPCLRMKTWRLHTTSRIPITIAERPARRWYLIHSAPGFWIRMCFTTTTTATAPRRPAGI